MRNQSGWSLTPPPTKARPARPALWPVVVVATLIMVMMAAPAFAAKGGNGKGNGNGHRLAQGSCSVDGNVVSAHGLPGDELVNFMVTEPDGSTHGWVLGTNPEGWWYVNVPDRTGPTTYEFVSRTWGPNGSKYSVFASCSAGV